MSDKNELSIDRITTLAIQDIVNSIREKIGRQLSDDESSFVEAIVGKEHFWARAEELLTLLSANHSVPSNSRAHTTNQMGYI